MTRFQCTDLPQTGLRRLQRQPLVDQRGRFERLFCARELAQFGWETTVAQVNLSLTLRRGTVRGLHFQRAPHAETKLVTCLHGEVWDVAVDLRADSPTFLQWHAETLSAGDGMSLLIPAGFAHGYQTLTDDTQLLYLHSAAHVPAAEAGISPLDPRLAIPWPLPPAGLSPRDASLPAVADLIAELRR